MAWTDKYVSTAGGGAHDGTSAANAWTWAEMIAAAPAALSRINVISDAGYSIGAHTLPANGTISAPILIRGYEATIGDLDNQGRNADGTLNTTNMPAITITGLWTPSPHCYLQNLNITGALSSSLAGGSNPDYWGMINCSVTNTQNNAAARAVLGDAFFTLINSDFYCSGAAHASVVEGGLLAAVEGCRIRGTSTSPLLTMDSGDAGGSLFWGNASAVGIVFNNALGTSRNIIRRNTFSGIGTAVTTPNSAPADVLILINNICANCSKWIDNLRSATANITTIECNNLLYTVTTPRTGVEAIVSGELSSDPLFVNAGAGNFRLDTSSPARAAGVTAYLDIGAYQHQDAGGGGASMMRPVVMSGGLT